MEGLAGRAWIKRQARTAAMICLLIGRGSPLDFYPGVPVQWVFLGLGVAFLLLSWLEPQRARGAHRDGHPTARYGAAPR